jgi:secreted PhoX family phosphatase
MSTSRQAARRQFLRGALATAGTVATLPALQSLNLLAAAGRPAAKHGKGWYGPLYPTKDLRDGVERIALPRGFNYRTFSLAGTTMSDGNLVPLAHDGMGVFKMKNGSFRLVRNHEDRNGPGAGSTHIDPSAAYDAKAGGGTTTLVVDPYTRKLRYDFLSLCGTTVNCAGGVTPWDSWVTCEETNVGVLNSNGTPSGWLKQHGYCFDVPVAANKTVPAVALPAMGRFSHEALAVDPNSWIVYETEDNSGGGGSSGFYRFIPKAPGNLKKGGKLQMLAVLGVSQYDARSGQTVGTSLPVTWVDIADPDPAGTSPTAVFDQGRALGGARFRRLEGCWWGNDAIYFADTSGGNAGFGTIWEYRPSRRHGGTLKLIFESSGQDQLDFPDNLTVSPQEALLLCEDGGGEQFLRGVTLDGRIFDLAKNLENDFEWAGATFAEADGHRDRRHDDDDEYWRGRNRRHDHDDDKQDDDDWFDSRHSSGNSRENRITLFVNRQGDTGGANPPVAGNEGMTFAIWGPWGEGAL